MDKRTQPVGESLGTEQLLDELVAEISEKLHAGEPVEWDQYAREHPEVADDLRRMLPALEALAELGNLPPSGAVSEEPSSRDRGLTRGMLGDYRIIREIGRGGMGVVYEAEQVSLGRKVALKVLPFAAMLDKRQLQRFQNEARAAACLRHPNIVQVHSVGCERAVHFYAMEYVEGQTLAEVIRDLRRAEGLDEGEVAGRKGEVGGCKAESGKRKAEVGKEDEQVDSALADSLASGRFAPPKPRSAAEEPTTAYTAEPTPAVTTAEEEEAKPPAGISTERSTKSPAYFRSIANLGMQVAEALDHAHQQGVIHRDMKPSNVILDTEGKAWVTDFGLARIETDATLTLSGDLLGTVRYMSPEQALAKRIVVDHRTDVYSLGVTLYELLTLQPAFTGQDREELLRQIAFEEPKAPRRLNKSVPAELETIVLKAMAKNPAERYDTAQELADDLERFLEDKPIRAKRPSLVHRAAKWSRRHKPVVAAAVVLLVMATVGFASSTYFVAQQKNRADDAFATQRELTREANRLRGQAERNLRRAQENLEQALEAADRLVTRAADDQSFNQPEMRELRRKLLEDALELYQAFLNEHGTDPVVRYQTARAYERIALVQSKLGEYAQAEKASHQCIGLLEGLAAESPSELKYQAGLARIQTWLGGILNSPLARPHDAEILLRQALPIHEKLVAEHPANSGYRYQLAFCCQHLGDVLLVTGRSHDAETYFRRAVVLREKLAAEFPTDPHSQSRLASARRSLGDLLAAAGRPEEAKKAYRQAMAIEEELLARLPAAPEYPQALAIIHSHLGDLLKTVREFDEAERSYRNAIALWKRLTADHGAVPGWRQGLTRDHVGLGDLLWKTGRLEEARQAFRDAVDLCEKLIADSPDEPIHRHWLAKSYDHLGRLLAEIGRFEDAAQQYREMLKLDPVSSAAHNSLARLLATCPDPKFRDPTEAVNLAKKAVELAPKERDYWNTLGAAHYRAGNWKTAIEALEKSIELRSGGDAFDQFFLAMAHCQLGRKDEGRQWYEKAVGWMQSNDPEDEELLRLRAEVEQLLSLAETPPTPKDKDVDNDE